MAKREANSGVLKAVLFDWDGTLVDSYDADSAAYEQMFVHFGIRWGAKEVDAHYSPNWHKIYEAAGIPKGEWGRADRLWTRYYQKQKTRLIPGARRVVDWVGRRWVMGLVTSGNRRRVQRQLRDAGLLEDFRVKIYAEDVEMRKPHAMPLVEALRRMRVEAKAAIYVGDAPEDVEMARAAGVRAIGVKGPFPTHHTLRAARPMELLERITELPEVLRAVARMAG